MESAAGFRAEGHHSMLFGPTPENCVSSESLASQIPFATTQKFEMCELFWIFEKLFFTYELYRMGVIYN